MARGCEEIVVELVSVAGWLLAIFPQVIGSAYEFSRGLGGPKIFQIYGKDVGGILILALPSVGLSLFTFPATILALVAWEQRFPQLGHRLAHLGDISYSSYLLHFPLQLGCMAVVLYLGVPDTIFRSPLTLLGFFAVLLVLSFCSYRYFERPVQRALRRRFFGRKDQPT